MTSHKINRIIWPLLGAVLGFLLGFLGGRILGSSDGNTETVTVQLFSFTVRHERGPLGTQDAAGYTWGYGLLALFSVLGAVLGLGVAAALNKCFSRTEVTLLSKGRGAWLRIALLVTLILLLFFFGIRWKLEQDGQPRTVARNDNPGALKVLFIGNSITFVNELPLMLATLSSATNEGQQAKVVEVVAGGLSLEDHWNKGHAPRAIREQGPWDYVVLQEQSTRAYDEWREMFKYARLFDAEIKKVGARTVLFVRPTEQDCPQDQDLLDEGCARLARELDAVLAPCGAAWATVRKRHPNLVLHHEDRGHPGPKGTYLSACVFYATLHGKSPEGLPGQLTSKGFLGTKATWVDLSPEMAADLQRTAWHTVQETKKRADHAERGQHGPHYGAIPALRADVALLRFFASGQVPLNHKEIEYSNRFARSNTKFVFWELFLHHPPPGQRLDFTVAFVYHRADGSVLGQGNLQSDLEPAWQSSFHTYGWGWSEAGNWPVGTYKVDLHVQGVKIASNTFEIYEDQPAP